MASISETGHAKNVANFETIVSWCASYCSHYNPANNMLALPQLTAKLADSKNILLSVKNKESDYKKAGNARAEIFSGLGKFATQVLAAAQASAISKEMIADLRTINRKIQGKKVAAPPTAAPGAELAALTTRTISSSQRSYDLLLDHFQKLIALLKADGTYHPNEANLQIAGMEAKADTMMAANTAVIQARAAWGNARLQRDKILYDETTGLKVMAVNVKNYIRSLFGSRSPEFLQISGLTFRYIILY